MMLRSASTPILGSLLSSTSSSLHFPGDSPSNSHYPTAFCHFSPANDGLAGHSPALGMRRTSSDGNLHSLLTDHHHHNHADDSLLHPPSVKCSASSRRTPPVLDTIPSFSVYNPHSVAEEFEQEEEEEEDDEIDAPGKERVQFHSASGVKEKDSGAGSATVPPLFLARGLGIDRIASGLLNVGGDDCDNGCGGGGRGRCDVLAGNGGEQSDVEMYYKKMVEENPTDALFLRNYAQFLYQAKGDLRRAEEYYSRAILADPGDGEILSQYAKVVWELHHDGERATSYFEQAVQAAPQDSHVLAAYAGFLWETEEDEGDLPLDFADGPARSGALAPATA